MTSLKRTNSSDPYFIELVQLLDKDLSIRDGDEHGFYSQFNKIDTINHVIVCFENDKAVGCGAFKPYDAQVVEIKRMYVREESRKKGIAAQILAALERWATELDYISCILETGKKQPEAIQLYQKVGYHVIPNYGQYAGISNSVCMKKLLGEPFH